MAVDISDLPPPPTKSKADISDLPVPIEPVSKAKAFGKSVVEESTPALGAYGGAELGAIAGAPFGPVGALAGGLIGGTAGYFAGEKFGKGAGQLIPESVKEATGFTKEQRQREKREAPVSSTLGTVVPDIAAITVSPLSQSLRLGATKVSDFVKGFRKPPPVGEVKDLAEIGEKGYKVLQNKADTLYKARSLEAEQKYDAAFNAARQAQAKGEPFATSPPGQALLQDLERQKTVIAGNRKFGKGEEEVVGIDRLINAIKGKTTGGQTVPVGGGPVSSKLTKKTPSETTEKDIKAIVEELRFLRDVDAKGKPYEAYAGLSAQYKRELINKLENSLYSWNPEYRVADEAYKAASAKLAPFKTELMSRALKGEKFNAKDLVASPEEFGPTFFRDVDGVRQLKAVTQDPAEVATLGKDYVATLLSNKTPAEVKSWAFDPKNTGWLQEAGIKDAVQNYANKASTAANRKEILRLLGYGTAVSSLGYAIGRPVSKSLGF